MKQVDILILSNGPGEVTTWVRPVVKALREKLGNDRNIARISVVLSPCPNASGKEASIARSYPEVDRVQGASDFFPFLLSGKTAENWDWFRQGVVVFLGGDQFFPVVIGKRLGYKTVVYAEWDARWHNLIDRFGVMKPEVAAKVSPKYAHKFTVVGDLMVEAGELGIREEEGEGVKGSHLRAGVTPVEQRGVKGFVQINTDPTPDSRLPTPTLIGILPGSKAAKLAQGVPLTIAIAQHIHAQKPDTKFIIPVAPTLDLETLASFANPQKNPVAEYFDFKGATLIEKLEGYSNPILKTTTGLIVELYTPNPAYDLLSKCSLCLTTVGANTAELGSLALPMIVLLPTQQLDAMRSWDGLLGILANLPGVGSSFAKLINWWFLRRKGLLAWPNIWAQEEIVPELVGKLKPDEVAKIALDYLENPEKLQKIREKLRNVRGEAGAAQKIAEIVVEVMS